MIPKIYCLIGIDHHGRYQEMMASDIKGLQVVLTRWLRGNGGGHIWRVS